MAFRVERITVAADTETLLVDAQAGDVYVRLQSPSAVTVYVGDGSDGTSGYMLPSGHEFSTRVRPGDQLYGYISSGGIVELLYRSA